MRLIYGVHGCGRGHAMRALALLPELSRRHDVLVVTGGDAYDVLKPASRLIRVPSLMWRYDSQGRIATWPTVRATGPLVFDVALGGTQMQRVVRTYRAFRPHAAISDSELFTHWAARRLKVPRITFDRFSALVHGPPPQGWNDIVTWFVQCTAYRLLFGRPDRVIATCFYPVTSRSPRVRIVGPVRREAIHTVQARRDPHLLVYLTHGQEAFTPRLERALLDADCPVRIYGVPRTGRHGNLEFKLIANRPFLEDLASCRAVLATTGNQLMGEVLYFRKPMLALPHNCLEQRINAEWVRRLAIGVEIDGHTVSSDDIRAFLSRESEFVSAHADIPRSDGAREAVEALNDWLTQIPSRNPAQAARRR